MARGDQFRIDDRIKREFLESLREAPASTRFCSVESFLSSDGFQQLSKQAALEILSEALEQYITGADNIMKVFDLVTNTYTFQYSGIDARRAAFNKMFRALPEANKLEKLESFIQSNFFKELNAKNRRLVLSVGFKALPENERTKFFDDYINVVFDDLPPVPEGYDEVIVDAENANYREEMILSALKSLPESDRQSRLISQLRTTPGEFLNPHAGDGPVLSGYSKLWGHANDELYEDGKVKIIDHQDKDRFFLIASGTGNDYGRGTPRLTIEFNDQAIKVRQLTAKRRASSDQFELAYLDFENDSKGVQGINVRHVADIFRAAMMKPSFPELSKAARGELERQLRVLEERPRENDIPRSEY